MSLKKIKKKHVKIIRDDGTIDTEVFIDVLSSDVDRQILTKLSKFPRYASDLAVDLGISKPAVKKHLEKLKQLGIILRHAGDDRDEKKQFYCINHDLSFSFNLDLSSNYFNYNTKNTDLINRDIIDKLEKESSRDFILQASVYGDKSKGDEESEFFRELGNITAKNESLTQLGRALRNIELQIREIENERYKLLAKKNEIIFRIKNVLNSLVSDSMEREIIFSFFYHTIESFEHGVSINRFLDDIFLKYTGSRAGVSTDQTTASIRKQRDRRDELEDLLNRIIKGFKFIRTKRDEKTNEQNIVFDF